MTVKEFIKENEGHYVKIGFGCGFIFCDFIEDVEYAYDAVKREEEAYKEKYENLLKIKKGSKMMLDKYKKWLKEFVPFLDAESKDIYPSEYDGSVIFISKDNQFIDGRYWDIFEYKGIQVPIEKSVIDNDAFDDLKAKIITVAADDLLDAFYTDKCHGNIYSSLGYADDGKGRRHSTNELLVFFTSEYCDSLCKKYKPQFFVDSILNCEFFVKDKDGSLTILWTPRLGKTNDIPRDSRTGKEFSGTVMRFDERYKKIIKEHCRQMNPEWYKNS